MRPGSRSACFPSCFLSASLNPDVFPRPIPTGLPTCFSSFTQEVAERPLCLPASDSGRPSRPPRQLFLRVQVCVGSAAQSPTPAQALRRRGLCEHTRCRGTRGVRGRREARQALLVSPASEATRLSAVFPQPPQHGALSGSAPGARLLGGPVLWFPFAFVSHYSEVMFLRAVSGSFFVNSLFCHFLIF